MKITKTELLEAVAKLDVANDADWTTDGLPSVDRVRDLALDDTISREDITSNALGFDREVAKTSLVAKVEVTADDAAKLAEAKSLSDAQEAAQDGVGKVADASEVKPTEDQDAEDRRMELQSAVNAAKEDLADFDLAMSKARAERERMQAVVDQAVKDLEAEFPPMRPADAVRQWLDSEHQKRLDRSGQASQLDQRFRRPTGYGNRRPSAPPVGSHG